jgi:hypothetical protein
MKINENLNLVLRDVYLYDIKACHYTILKNLGFDLSNINFENKLERNIQIGQMMKKNPRLTSLLRSTTRSMIDEYILRNKVEADEIILRQYDGLLLTRTLRETHLEKIPLNIRRHFEIFISSVDRTQYIAKDSQNKISIKGVPFRYTAMDNIYKQICNINFSNKTAIFKQLQKIKDSFLNSNDAKLFGIPIKENFYNVYLKKYGEIEISKQTLNIMDTDDVDKERYFNFYITPFTKSIVIEFVR